MQESIWLRVDLDLSDQTRRERCCVGYLNEKLTQHLSLGREPDALYAAFESILNTQAEEQWYEATIHAFQFDLRTYSWMLLIEPQSFTVTPQVAGFGRQLPIYEILPRAMTRGNNGTL